MIFFYKVKHNPLSCEKKEKIHNEDVVLYFPME